MRTMKIRGVGTSLAIGAVLLIGVGPASGQTPPDLSSFTVPLPSFDADTFTLVFRGDLTGVFPAQVASDPATDPFALAGGTPSVTASFDVGSDTTDLIFKGAPIGPGTAVPSGPVTFGVNEGVQPGGGVTLLGATWSSSTSPDQQAVPVASITLPRVIPPPPSTSIFIITVETEFGVYEYLIFPMPNGGENFPIDIGNNTPSDITLVGGGYFFSPTLIPLDSLNPGSLPPPGQPGSPFIPLPSLGGITLAPGSSVVVTVPEPSSAIGLGQGLLALAALARHRRARRRSGERLVPSPRRGRVRVEG